MRAALAVFVTIVIVTMSFVIPAETASTFSSYSIIVKDGMEFLTRFKAGGATDAQIEALLDDIDDEVNNVKAQNLLTDNNFNSVMFETLVNVLTWRKHRTVADVMLATFGEEIDYMLTNRKVHPEMMPLYNSVYASVFHEDKDNTTPGGGGAPGGTIPDIVDISSLENEVSTAEALLNNVRIGSLPGQYTEEAKNEFLQALASAKIILTNQGATQQDINEEIIRLGGAYIKFNNQMVVFTDTKSHWAENYIREMLRYDLVQGVSAAHFNPNSNITRAEFAAMLVRALGIESFNQSVGLFDDVSADKWYFNEVNAAAQAGLVTGMGGSIFSPESPIIREQMAVMTARAIEYKNQEQITNTTDQQAISLFNDAHTISLWAVNGVAVSVQNEIIKGRTDGSFDPHANATRAEAAVMVLRIYKQVTDTAIQ